MESEKYRAHVASTSTSDMGAEDRLDDPEWRNAAEKPGVLQDFGRGSDDSLSSDDQGLKVYLEDLKLTYEMLRSPDFSLKKEIKTVLIVAALYLVSPIDLIPDAIPFIGALDDVLVAGYAIKKIAAELGRYRQYKQNTS